LGTEIGSGVGAVIGIAFSLISAYIIYKTFFKTNACDVADNDDHGNDEQQFLSRD